MTLIKNRYFILMTVFLGIISVSFNTVSARTYTQKSDAVNTKIDTQDSISYMPDAVVSAEKLHTSANRSYKVRGQRYYPKQTINQYAEEGQASWYGKAFHGRKTSSGERYNMHEMTAAHRTLPIPSYAKVTNLKNGKSVVVRINDRGPFHGKRVIDLSFAAAQKLAYTNQGVATVRIEQVLPQDKPQNGSLNYVTLKSFDDVAEAQDMMHKVADKLKEDNKPQKVSMIYHDDAYDVRLGPVDPKSITHNTKRNLITASL